MSNSTEATKTPDQNAANPNLFSRQWTTGRCADLRGELQEKFNQGFVAVSLGNLALPNRIVVPARANGLNLDMDDQPVIEPKDGLVRATDNVDEALFLAAVYIPVSEVLPGSSGIRKQRGSYTGEVTTQYFANIAAKSYVVGRERRGKFSGIGLAPAELLTRQDNRHWSYEASRPIPLVGGLLPVSAAALDFNVLRLPPLESNQTLANLLIKHYVEQV